MKTSWKKCLGVLLVCMFLFSMSACSPKEAGPLPAEEKVPEIDFWITSQTYDPVRYEIGLLAAEKWRELGFDVETTTMEWSTMSSQGMKSHEHEVFMIQWGGKAERIDPMEWLYTMHHSAEAGEGGYNIAGYLNPAYDELVEKFVTNMDMDKRKDFAATAQEILAKDVPQPPIVHRILTHAYNSRDFSNPTFAMGEGLNSFWNWMSFTPNGDRKTVKYGYINDIKLLNPLMTKDGADIYILKMIYDPLVRIDPDGIPQPWAAESYSEIDSTTIEIKLRKGMVFHDDKPVTVEDVKYTFDLAKEVKSPYYLSKIDKVKEVQIIDDQTVRFVLSEPYAPFITNGLGTMGILPKHIWEPRFKEGGADAVLNWDNVPPVGSGPFKFEYWRPNEELKLSSFTKHFSPPKIDGMIRIPYAKAYGVVQGLKAGEIDAAGWSLLPLEQQELKEASHLTLGTAHDQGYYMLHYNMRKAPFDDVNIRRALTYAIPKQQIVELVFEGMAIPAYSTVAEVNKFWHNPNIEKVGDDMEKAKEILVEAGFRWDDNGAIYFPEDYQVKKFSD